MVVVNVKFSAHDEKRIKELHERQNLYFKGKLGKVKNVEK